MNSKNLNLIDWLINSGCEKGCLQMVIGIWENLHALQENLDGSFHHHLGADLLRVRLEDCACEKIRDEGTNETARCRSWVHRFQYASRHLLCQIAR